MNLMFFSLFHVFVFPLVLMMIVLIHVMRTFYVHYQSFGRGEGKFSEVKVKVKIMKMFFSFLFTCKISILDDEGKSLLGAGEFYFHISS